MHVPTGYIYSTISDMARWAGIHLGIVDVPPHFSDIVQRSLSDMHTVGNPFGDFDFRHAAGGWLIWDDSGIVEHSGAATGYVAAVRINHAYDTAVVMLGNLGVFGSTVNQLSNIIMETVVFGTFDNVGADFYVILDIVLVAAIVWGIFSLYKFARLVMKTLSRLRAGENIRYRGIKPSWLFDLAFSVAVLLAIYLVLPNIFGLPVAFLITVMPLNFLIAIIFAWIDLVHTLFGLWVKAFI
jgi:hypothetical protein